LLETGVIKAKIDLAKIVAHLEGLGFERILLTPATDLTGKSHGLRVEDLPVILAAYDVLAERSEAARLEGRSTSVVWFDTLWTRLLSGKRQTQFCGGGRDYLGVAADGEVSLCYRFYQNGDYAMGNVFDGITRSEAVDQVLVPLDQRTACSQCWARHFCGGGCHHENLVTTGRLGDPNPVTCEILRHGMGRTLSTWGRLVAAGKITTRSVARCEGPLSNEDERNMATDGAEIDSNEKPKTKATCHVRDVGVECVVYEPTVHEVVFLNATAAWIFDQCDGSRSVEDIVADMALRYAAPIETLRKDLVETLSMFRRKGLLV
ncbi:MAG TPA: PqqD family peptide modification chaperone, partial [Planctomycetota bacterium]|nr:PqqD family peptide modification chaperone [Planctomycetota bacterium]